jgi:hypothetical protein
VCFLSRSEALLLASRCVLYIDVECSASTTPRLTIGSRGAITCAHDDKVATIQNTAHPLTSMDVNIMGKLARRPSRSLLYCTSFADIESSIPMNEGRARVMPGSVSESGSGHSLSRVHQCDVQD